MDNLSYIHTCNILIIIEYFICNRNAVMQPVFLKKKVQVSTRAVESEILPHHCFDILLEKKLSMGEDLISKSFCNHNNISNNNNLTSGFTLHRTN